MARARFVEDPMFEDNLLHWRGSLNPVGDKFRSVSNRMAKGLKSESRAKADEYAGSAAGLWDQRFRKSQKQRYKFYKTIAFSLKKYSELTYAAEIHQSDQNIAIVASGHAASLEIEFGGTDEVLMAGDEPLQYPAFRFLGKVVNS